MKKRILSFLFFSFLLFIQSANAQFTDDFSDGDFSANPAWTGNTSDFIVNGSFQLQSNNTVANSQFYLSTPSTKATTAEWEFWCQMSFNPSSANYIDFYLTASASDITQASTTGYFVRVGNSSDEISLYRKDAGGTITEIIDGLDGTLGSNNVMKIKVIRDGINQWTLLRDLTGTGNNFSSEGSVADATYTTSAFFGIYIKQSTASFFQKHFFDDFVVQTYVPDVTPPAIQSLTALSPNTLDVLFDEPVELASGQTLSNYSANNGIGMPVTAARDVANNALVHLSFTNTFPNGINNTITINGVKDLSGNAIVNGNGTFSFYMAQRFDIIIDELMADPTPVVGLPNNEWIELKNTSAFPINLQGWTISDASGNSGGMPNFILQPDSYVIVCTGSAVAAMSTFGTTISVTSFPSLDNDGEQLSLMDANGKIIHALAYQKSWYQNTLKEDGGWSLEMIDTHNPCSGSDNWKASSNAQGGTPGQKNSVDAINTDDTPPKLLRAYTVNTTTIVAVFSEPIDSMQGATVANYQFSNGIQILSAVTKSPLFNEVQLSLSASMQLQTMYTLTASGIADCKSNTMTNNTVKVGMPEDADALDMIVNEILFNPRPTGYDYVEFYNKSQKIFDASKMYIANRNSSNDISSITQFSATPWLIFPGDYIVVTQDAESLNREYLVSHPEWVLTVSSMPSFPDAEGFVLVLNQQGEVVDEVDYNDDWHFKLIDDDEGVSLERIDPDAPSQEASNWHSAASTAGYGTPTYKNSQYKLVNPVSATVAVVPKVFSPDNDGRDDIATIQYEVTEPGYVANITIFDAAGRPIRNLVRNGTLGLKGYWNWDGLDDKGHKLPIGSYIIYTEIFNLQGKKQHFKNVVVLARKL